jgi:hypothetical protein
MVGSGRRVLWHLWGLWPERVEALSDFPAVNLGVLNLCRRDVHSPVVAQIVNPAVYGVAVRNFGENWHCEALAGPGAEVGFQAVVLG